MQLMVRCGLYILYQYGMFCFLFHIQHSKPNVLECFLFLFSLYTFTTLN